MLAFGLVSWVAPLTNLLVLFTIPPLTVLGFGVAFAGLVWQPLAWISYLPCQIILTYLLSVLDIFGKPWASIAVGQETWPRVVSWAFVVIYYCALFVLLKWWQKKQKPQFLGF
jgi:hypothetical protein